jgi:predicted RNase H-like nuclease (RuvC/YqgF family)
MYCVKALGSPFRRDNPLENLALIVIEWVGKIIAGKLAGSALSAAWKRVYPDIRKALQSSRLARLEAEAEISRVEELEGQVQNYAILLREAAAQIDRLKAENAELRHRLAKYEPPAPE